MAKKKSMIQITDKSKCCSCEACEQVCPKACISMEWDAEGFLYPRANEDICIKCGLCEKVCPCLNLKKERQPLGVYAAVNPDVVVRRKSSSGGVFWMLVEQIIEDGGVVFGAAFDKDWMVFHSSADTLEEAKKFRGSKYVQSRMNGCYKEAQSALKQGRKVLFCGTACQIAGLKDYLKKEYNNLVTLDVVCHGVPSPGIWRDYLSHIGKGKKISNINFRDKSTGWRNYDFVVTFTDGSGIKEPHNSNLYMQGFLQNLYLRPSCHNCNFKLGKCGSDLTLGDFWGIEKVRPELDDNQGASVVLVNTLQGKNIFQKLNCVLNEVGYDDAIFGNPCMTKSAPMSEYRFQFMRKYQNGGDIISISDVLRSLQPSVLKRLLRKAKRALLHK